MPDIAEAKLRELLDLTPKHTDADLEWILAMAESWGLPLASTVATLLHRGLCDAMQMGVCRHCGCTEHDACVYQSGAACYWVREDLCSQCSELRKP